MSLACILQVLKYCCCIILAGGSPQEGTLSSSCSYIICIGDYAPLVIPLTVLQHTYEVAGWTCGAVHDLQVQDVVTFCHRQTGASWDPSAAEHQRMVHEGQAELVRLREALTVAGGGSGCLECKDGSHRCVCSTLCSSPGMSSCEAPRVCGTGCLECKDDSPRWLEVLSSFCLYW